jgi:phosphate:Na+ symporter
MIYIIDFLSVVGAIGLFLFGVKLMSESLQKIAGNKLRAILAYIASSKIKAVFSGLVITALVQASAVVTVMAVSFVHAGIISLTESVGIIMGATIGTTIKAWLIAALGFNAQMGMIALPVIGITFPFLFSKHHTRRNWGGFFFGIALLFLSLDFMNFLFTGMRSNTALIGFLSGFSGFGFGSLLLYVFAGMLLTALIQSSSVMVTFTFVMCSSGWIPFEYGAAMILGENIGTTVTANIAAIVANIQGKRTALIHTLIKVIGVVWVLIVFKWFLLGTDFITFRILGISPLTDIKAMPLGLAVFHSLFNVANTILLIGFIPYIVKLSEKMIPSKAKSDEKRSLKFINSSFTSSELVLDEAKKEIVALAKTASRQFSRIPDLLVEKDEKEYERLFQTIADQEEIIDKQEEVINAYLNQIYRGELSLSGINNVKSMQRIAKELESVGDSVYHMAKSINWKNREKAWFTQEQRDDLKKMYDLMFEAFDVLITNLEKDYNKVSLDKAQMLELQVNKLRDDLMAQHFHKATSPDYNNKSSVIYVDLISASENMADHMYNINEAISGLK